MLKFSKYPFISFSNFVVSCELSDYNCEGYFIKTHTGCVNQPVCDTLCTLGIKSCPEEFIPGIATCQALTCKTGPPIPKVDHETALKGIIRFFF